MSPSPRRILITTALPYANGALHLGHLVEYIQADIWARFHKLNGHDCLFISGNDAHGTPIMISAQKRGITPEALVAAVHEERITDFAGFLVDFDYFDATTHAPENQALANQIYYALRDNKDIFTREIAQAFDPEKQLFLPDRYVKGDCPRCGANDQYGDNCEACGATYAPTELKNPVSALSGATPIQKHSLHYFFQLEKYTDALKKWINSGKLQPQIANKLAEWFEVGLQPWDISRDAPYFGFEIPDAPGKYFYVWLDAPIGYMASLKKLCATRKDICFDDYWKKDSVAELYHFIGKDIVYFHALFWPALLMGSNFRTPSAIFTHGFLNLNGQKMSKSRGTFITARDYLTHLNPEYLRYYFAAKLNSHVEDIDLNLTDFVQRINADLIGKYINIASRCAGFIHKFFAGKLGELTASSIRGELNQDPHVLYQHFIAAGEVIAKHYEQREFQHAVREIMALADLANQYIADQQPWIVAKDTAQLAEVQTICTAGLNLFRLLTLYLKPILPTTALAVENFLNTPEPLTWQNSQQPLFNHLIQPFKPLLQRIDPESINALLADTSKATATL